MNTISYISLKIELKLHTKVTKSWGKKNKFEKQCPLLFFRDSHLHEIVCPRRTIAPTFLAKSYCCCLQLCVVLDFCPCDQDMHYGALLIVLASIAVLEVSLPACEKQNIHFIRCYFITRKFIFRQSNIHKNEWKSRIYRVCQK